MGTAIVFDLLNIIYSYFRPTCTDPTVTFIFCLTLCTLILNTGHKPLLPQPILVDISPDASTTLVAYSYTSQNTETNFNFPENLH